MTFPEVRRAAAVCLAAAIGVAVTANLGFWQLRRAAQKVALQTAIDTRAALPALTAVDLLEAARRQTLPDLHFRRVTLQGRWLNRDTVFLENRQMNARVGFYVVTPLQLAGRPEAVLVQRGWVPRDLRDRTLLPPVPTPAGTVELSGLIAPPPSRLYEFAPSASGVIRQNIEVAGFAAETGLKLLPLSVQETPVQETPVQETPVQETPVQETPVQETPVQETPVQETPVPATPVPATPVRQTALPLLEARATAGSRAAAPGAPSTATDGLTREWPRPAVNVDMHYGYAFQWFALGALMAGLCVWFQIVQPWLRRGSGR